MPSVGTPPTPVAPTITVDLLEADAVTSVVADLGNIVDGRLEDPIEPGGVGELSVGLESADKAEFTKGRVLRWNGTGTNPVHTIIESNDQVSRTESLSKIPRQITLSGRNLVAQWDDVRVQQWPGMEQVPYYTRHFNYASPGKDTEINGTAYEHADVLNFDSYGQPVNPEQPPPRAWRDRSAKRIWTAPYSGSQRIGTSLFRTTLTPSTGTILRAHGSADDRLLAWIGGVPFLRGPDAPTVMWEDTWADQVELQLFHTYPLVVRCENEYSVPPYSVAWLGFSAWELVSDVSEINATNLAVHTDSSWTALECIDIPTPGWTVPEILTVLLAEWQAANQLDGWAVVDATPGEWTSMIETNFETQKITGFGVIGQFADGQAEFDVIVEGGVKKLRCFAPGLMGDYHTSPTAPIVEDVSLTELAHQWVQS